MSQMVAEGCPMTSVRAAERWREERGNKRRSTNPKQVNKEAGETPKRGRGRPRSRIESSNTGDSLLDALNNSITVADEAFKMVSAAIAEGNAGKLGIMLGVHNKATEARFTAEKSYREELERRKLLINFHEAAEMYRKGFDFILTRLKRMPQAKAPHCNQQFPLVAYEVLDAAVQEIIADAQAQYAPEVIK